METKRFWGNRLVSVFSLMRDGAELAEQLRQVRSPHRPAASSEKLGQLVRPYLQFVKRNDVCDWTGLLLTDVWRYFRHTWASPAKSIPGRSMMILVRDAAAECHPVVGIAALSSAAAAITVRDRWIGWTAKAVIDEVKSKPTVGLARWLQQTVDAAIGELYLIDLFEGELLTPQDLRSPTRETIKLLEADGEEQREKHRRLMAAGEYKKNIDPRKMSDEDWEQESRTHLFRSKRAEDLAQLLSIRMVLRKHFGTKPTRAGLMGLASTGEGREAIQRIVRRAKAARMGTAIADLTICGAVPPYQEILGGKLVAALMTSPEVLREYRRRYGGASSVIASSMAGQRTIRTADLVFIGTTSLYGERPNQYDRIRVDFDTPGGSHGSLTYRCLGKTEGVGTVQFGDQTVAELGKLLAQSRQGQRVNSVFGEGVNPRLRKLRDGLDELGLETDELLTHGSPRVVYGVTLVENLQRYLLGMDRRPKYLVPQRRPQDATRHIVGWWFDRWVSKRIERDEILARMSQHTHVHPVRHGARVRLPSGDVDQKRLFD